MVMQLRFEEIKSITQGAVYITEEDERITFHRFSKEEEILYSTTQFRDKVYSTAGVQLEFLTDADSLYLEVETSPATSRTYFSVDVFVDGAVRGCIRNFDENAVPSDYTGISFPLGRFLEDISLGNGEKRVRIVFPWSVKAQLCELRLGNATYVTPYKKRKTIFMYGDSITNGYDALFTSHSYAAKFADSLDAELYNKGIGGEVFFPELAQCKKPFSPDYITIAYGTNDWGKEEKEDFIQRCEAFFAALAKNYPDTEIVAITPIWRRNYLDYRVFGDFFDVERTICRVCAQYPNIKTIRGWELVPHDELYYADGRVHPNDKGFEQYYKNLKEKIDTERVF